MSNHGDLVVDPRTLRVLAMACADFEDATVVGAEALRGHTFGGWRRADEPTVAPDHAGVRMRALAVHLAARLTDDGRRAGDLGTRLGDAADRYLAADVDNGELFR